MAEVLITLGIIGIIAAMTLPNLIGNYKMKTYEVAFKKQYALLQNTMNLLTVENGTNKCYTYFPGGMTYKAYIEDCELFKAEIVNRLNLHKYDVDLNRKYARPAEVFNEGGDAINKSCGYDEMIVYSDPYISNDGTVFMFSHQYIVIDINGEKNPNKWGYDVFWVGWSNHNKYEDASSNLLLTDEFCSLIEKGGKFPRTILQNQKMNTATTGDWTW